MEQKKRDGCAAMFRSIARSVRQREVVCYGFKEEVGEEEDEEAANFPQRHRETDRIASVVASSSSSVVVVVVVIGVWFDR